MCLSMGAYESLIARGYGTIITTPWTVRRIDCEGEGPGVDIQRWRPQRRGLSWASPAYGCHATDTVGDDYGAKSVIYARNTYRFLAHLAQSLEESRAQHDEHGCSPDRAPRRLGVWESDRVFDGARTLCQR